MLRFSVNCKDGIFKCEDSKIKSGWLDSKNSVLINGAIYFGFARNYLDQIPRVLWYFGATSI